MKALLYCSYVLIFITSLSIVRGDLFANISIKRNVNASNPNVAKVIHLLSNETVSETIYIPDDYKYAFFVIQVHSFNQTVLLSTDLLKFSETVNGTDTGLVQTLSNQLNYNFYVKSTSDVSHKVQIIITTYEHNSPIPGGCNMVYNTEIAPYFNVSLSDAMIQIDVAPPSIPFKTCENDLVDVQLYYIDLQYDYSLVNYFYKIETLADVNGILKHGQKLPKRSIYLRFYLSNYNMPSVYTAIATYKNGSSAYIPVAVYGCEFSQNPKTCWDLGQSPQYDIIAIVLIIYGFLMMSANEVTIMFGNVSFIFSCLLSIAGQTISSNVSIAYVVLVAFLITVLITSLLVRRRGIVKAINAFVTGFIFSSVFMFFKLTGDLTIMEDDTTYWIIFAVIWIMIFPFAFTLNGLTTVPGITLFCVGWNHYWGQDILKYVFINIYRRMFVDNFNYAIIAPPITMTENGIIIFACLMSLVLYRNTRKVENALGERTPLVSA